MRAVDGYFVITPEDLCWMPSNLMKIPNADFLERTKSEILGARLWRLPPKSANILKLRSFILFCRALDSPRRRDVDMPKYGGVPVGP
jgi:hypothetical protein